MLRTGCTTSHSVSAHPEACRGGAAAWLGHSVEVAREHYLSILPEHFALATGAPAQNPAQHGTEQPRTDAKGENTDRQNVSRNPERALVCASAPDFGLAPPGLEPGTERL